MNEEMIWTLMSLGFMEGIYQLRSKALNFEARQGTFTGN